MDVTSAINVARLTNIGMLRERNEDAVASELKTGLMIVADGMGGYKGGAEASEMAILVITSEFAELAQRYQALNQPMPISAMLRQAVTKANNAILAVSQQNADHIGMGATFVAGAFYDNKLISAHMGDSRLYRLRDNDFEQLTEDHSFLQEQLNAGLITQEEADVSSEKHLVTRALGADVAFELEVHEFDVLVDDLYLFCSDGLTDCVDDEEIYEILINSQKDIDLAVNRLITLANKHGGKDNISVVLAQVVKPFANERSWLKKVLG